MNILSQKTCLITFLLFIVVISCKKDNGNSKDKDQNPKTNAQYNNTLTPGVGDMFVNGNLQPNQDGQVFASIVYKGDTLAFAGATNAKGQVTETNTLLFVQGQETIVFDYSNNFKEVISYVVNKGQKQNLIVRVQAYSLTEKEVSVLDYNWSANTFKVLTSVYYVNGIPKATSAKRKTTLKENSEAFCEKAPPADADELGNTVQQDIRFIECGGTHPVNIPTVKLFEQLEGDKKKALEAWDGLKNKYVQAQSPVTGNAKGYKFSTTLAGKAWTWFAKKTGLFEDRGTIEIDGYRTDVEFLEHSDDNIQVVFQVRDKNNKPYTKAPSIVNFGLRVEGTRTYLYNKSQYTNPETGKVTFTITIPEIKDIDDKVLALEGVYAANLSQTTNVGTIPVTFKWQIPRLTLVSGNDQTADPGKKLARSLIVKVTDQDGRIMSKVPVYWNVKAGGGKITPALGATDLTGRAEAEWTLGATETDQTVEATAKNKDGSVMRGAPVHFAANLTDSLKLYTAAAIGKWIFTWHFKDDPSHYEIDKFNLEEHGKGNMYYIENHSQPGSEIKIGDPPYWITWNIERDLENRFYLTIRWVYWGNFNGPFSMRDRIFYKPAMHYGTKTDEYSYVLGKKQ